MLKFLSYAVLSFVGLIAFLGIIGSLVPKQTTEPQSAEAEDSSWKVVGVLTEGLKIKFVRMQPQHAKDIKKYDGAVETLCRNEPICVIAFFLQGDRIPAYKSSGKFFEDGGWKNYPLLALWWGNKNSGSYEYTKWDCVRAGIRAGLCKTNENPSDLDNPTNKGLPIVPPVNSWLYYETKGKMDDEIIKFARTDSLNTFEFSFPYGGEQHATLSLRSHPKQGVDVRLSIERGQFLGGNYDGGAVQVRFDDKKAVIMETLFPSDHSTTTMFIKDSSVFFKKLKKANKVLISANVYQEGAPIFEFDVSGLKWGSEK